MKHFIGIDNSTIDHKISIIDEVGIVKDSFVVNNTFEGFTKLEERIQELTEPILGFELSHGLFVEFLKTKGMSFTV